MGKIKEELKRIMEDQGSLKIVSSQNRDGVIHSVPKGSLEISGEDELTYVEVLESSASYRNIVYSIWFDKKVSVLVVGEQKEAYLIHGHVRKILTSGREYEGYYRNLQETRGFDIAAVVRIAVEDVKDLNLAKAIEKQKAEHPFFQHYDSIAIDQSTK